MKASYYKWYTSEDNIDIKPINGETVIVACFYDGWHYNFGYYLEETNEICFLDETDNIRILLNHVEKWMMIEEPSLKIN